MRPSSCHTVRKRSQSPASRQTTQFSTSSRIASVSSLIGRIIAGGARLSTAELAGGIRDAPRSDRGDLMETKAPRALVPAAMIVGGLILLPVVLIIVGFDLVPLMAVTAWSRTAWIVALTVVIVAVGAALSFMRFHTRA